MRRRYKKPQPPQVSGNEAFFKPTVQKKLSVGEPNDAYEVEADAMADKVTNKTNNETSVQKAGTPEDELQQKPLAASITPLVQKQKSPEDRPVQTSLFKDKKDGDIQKMEEEEEQLQAKCDDCEKEEAVQKMEEEEESIQAQEEEEETLQPQEDEEEAVQKQEEEESIQAQEEEEQLQAKDSEKTTASPSTERKLKASSGGGSKMDKKTTAEMESGFGADLSNVNIHTDSNAVQMNKELGAQAFTHGNDVYFNKGKYNPDTKEGKHLLAHELTHTIQQTGNVQRSIVEQPSKDLEASRFKGNFRLEQAHDHIRFLRHGDKGKYVEKLQNGLMDIGFHLPKFGADGDFGSETKNTVIDFQNEFDLQIDGVVGQQTMGTLDDIYSGKNLNVGCCGDAFQLPQTNIEFNINSSVLTKMTFCSKGNFKISSFADWVKPHSAKHYHIFLVAVSGGTINKVNRRYDIGRRETQSFKVKASDGCIFFKVLIKVIDPGSSPNLKGNFSVTN